MQVMGKHRWGASEMERAPSSGRGFAAVSGPRLRYRRERHGSAIMDKKLREARLGEARQALYPVQYRIACARG